MPELRQIYDNAFYAEQAEGSYRSALKVLSVVLKQLGSPASILDVGCGVGTWLHAAQELLTSCEIQGVDHPGVLNQKLQIPKEHFLERDLSTNLQLNRRFDLVISLEVAEHIDPEKATTFVGNLTRHGDCILFSAAIPGQGGTHHVNERFPSYWIEKFKAEGYTCYDTIRPELWLDPEVAFWYQQNILLFARQPESTLEGLRSFRGEPLVHPELIRRRLREGFIERSKPFRRRLLKMLGIAKYRKMHIESW